MLNFNPRSVSCDVAQSFTDWYHLRGKPVPVSISTVRLFCESNYPNLTDAQIRHVYNTCFEYTAHPYRCRGTDHVRMPELRLYKLYQWFDSYQKNLCVFEYEAPYRGDKNEINYMRINVEGGYEGFKLENMSFVLVYENKYKIHPIKLIKFT